MLPYIAYYISGAIISLPGWIEYHFGKITFEQLLFHALTGFDGLAGTDWFIIASFSKDVLTIPCAIPITLLLTKYIPQHLPLKQNISAIELQRTAGFSSSRSKEKIARIIGNKWLCLAILLISITSSLYRVGVAEYVQNWLGKDKFSALYHRPESAAFKNPATKKNLVLIYVESLEHALTNEELMGENLIKPITDLEGFEIKDFKPAPGTGWSIAGMISSQCSIPLKPYHGNYQSVWTKSIFPNLTCLGDILSARGYRQHFLVGPDLKFSGMDKFYFSHGYNEALGRDEWLRSRKMDPGLFTGWGEGLQDDTLFEEAFRTIRANKANKQSYNLTLITTDNHAPNGFPSPRCPEEEKEMGELRFANVFKCTSRFVADFVNKLKREGLLDDTVVVIMGDHIFVNRREHAKYFSTPRNVYFKYITDTPRAPSRTKMNHFDVAPTILDLLSLAPDREYRFGLGISLFAEIDPEEYETHYRMVMDKSILNTSPTYDAFWFRSQ